MNNKTNNAENNTPVRDEAAPQMLTVEIKDKDGNIWSMLIATAKEFKTGSVGFYCGDKVTNPNSGKRYQVGMNITLIGSKPKK